MLSARKTHFKSGEIYYLTDGHPHTYREMLEGMARALGVRPFSFPVHKFTLLVAAKLADVVGKLSGQSLPLNGDKVHEILPDFWVFSDQKARETFGYRSQFDLDQGMLNAVRWYRENGWL